MRRRENKHLGRGKFKKYSFFYNIICFSSKMGYVTRFIYVFIVWIYYLFLNHFSVSYIWNFVHYGVKGSTDSKSFLHIGKSSLYVGESFVQENFCFYCTYHSNCWKISVSGIWSVKIYNLYTKMNIFIFSPVKKCYFCCLFCFWNFNTWLVHDSTKIAQKCWSSVISERVVNYFSHRTTFHFSLSMECLCDRLRWKGCGTN